LKAPCCHGDVTRGRRWPRTAGRRARRTGGRWTRRTAWWPTTSARWRSASPTEFIPACREPSESPTNRPPAALPSWTHRVLRRLVLRRVLRRAVRYCVEVLRAPRGALAGLVPTVAHTLVRPISHHASDQTTSEFWKSSSDSFSSTRVAFTDLFYPWEK